MSVSTINFWVTNTLVQNFVNFSNVKWPEEPEKGVPLLGILKNPDTFCNIC